MSSSDLLSATGALLLVVALIFLLRFGARFLHGRGGRVQGSRITLEAHCALDGKRRLHLVRCEGRDLLILSGGATDVMMAWPPASGVSA